MYVYNILMCLFSYFSLMLALTIVFELRLAYVAALGFTPSLPLSPQSQRADTQAKLR